MAVPVYGVDVELVLEPGTDPRAPGGEVTVALCGHWEHDGACRWPHNSSIGDGGSPARLRTVVAVDDDERDDVFGRIESALRADERWTVVSFAIGGIRSDEAGLAQRLSGGV
jgi:hypothetical protein